jgi:hypothetical protein
MNWLPIRHTVATSLIEAGADIWFVQCLLGHQSIATTQLYIHVSDRELKGANFRESQAADNNIAPVTLTLPWTRPARFDALT